MIMKEAAVNLGIKVIACVVCLFSGELGVEEDQKHEWMMSRQQQRVQLIASTVRSI